MIDLEINGLRTFIGAKDYKLSRSFYTDLGFQESVISDNLSQFKNGDFSFFLQNYYAKEWLENTMLFLEVSDVANLFYDLKQSDIEQKYPGVQIIPVKKESWGAVCFVIDPSGVLLHFGQLF